ncbi:nucleotidyl transferase AbiEii/AbiGii toxin family protein [Mucilaginibacter corticis]|nr:nucleotidyl transferase AbiEii/AbiGii toxin family protein [Mucilaginibacter corticis]
MHADEFKDFRLVGGTSLSLQLGHRMSVDIDLFTDSPYGSIDFKAIEKYFLKNYPYILGDINTDPGLGKSYIIGEDKYNSVKVDVFYAMDPFFQPMVIENDIRMATVEEIIAMKMDIVQRKGRKKDFWDIHELLESYSVEQMVALHGARFEYTHEPETIMANFTDFEAADKDEDPQCLRGKEWTFIKQDIIEAIERGRQSPSFTR